MRVAPAVTAQGEESEVVYATTLASYRDELNGGRFYRVPDANLRSKARLAWLAVYMLYVVLRERPDVVISTGAAPGYFAIRFAKWIGAKSIWIDSMANAEKLSKSGQEVGGFADLWLTQWPHLAEPNGPQYVGAVL